MTARRGIAFACFGLAALLHVTLCEWRTLEYGAEEAPDIEARVLLGWRRVEHGAGNAPEWDRKDAALDVYNAAWGLCYEDIHGTPAAASAMGRCLESRRFAVETPTSGAVARVACERESYGGVRERDAIERCLAAKGHEATHLPCWTSERIGRRFAGPYTHQSALLAEAWLAKRRAGLPLSIALGIATPGVLVLTGVVVLGRLRR